MTSKSESEAVSNRSDSKTFSKLENMFRSLNFSLFNFCFHFCRLGNHLVCWQIFWKQFLSLWLLIGQAKVNENLHLAEKNNSTPVHGLWFHAHAQAYCSSVRTNHDGMQSLLITIWYEKAGKRHILSSRANGVASFSVPSLLKSWRHNCLSSTQSFANKEERSENPHCFVLLFCTHLNKL